MIRLTLFPIILHCCAAFYYAARQKSSLIVKRPPTTMLKTTVVLQRTGESDGAQLAFPVRGRVPAGDGGGGIAVPPPCPRPLPRAGRQGEGGARGGPGLSAFLPGGRELQDPDRTAGLALAALARGRREQT